MTMGVGSGGPSVGNWQRFLNDQRMADAQDHPLVEDERYGARTQFATRRWQFRENLPQSGRVDALDLSRAKAQGFIPFVQAKHFTPVWPSRRLLDSVVIHTMEYPERPTGAEWCADFFAGRNGMTAPKASAHFCIDQDSIVQCVRTMDVAWHAPGANHNGVGIEHVGYAKQSAKEWEDEASKAVLDRSARLTAKICKEHGIPVRKLTPDELKRGERGICGHHDVTLGFPGPGRTHWDPGPSFPWERYLSLVAAN